MAYKTPTWQRKEGQSESGGLSEAGRRSLRAAGHDIKRPQPEGGPRKKSFCARMKGMKAHNTSAETANDPDSRINKSLRKWKCADGGEITVDNALRMARGRPDEGGQERFLREQLAGSAPQYDPNAGMETAKEAGRALAGMTTPGAIADAAGYLGSPSTLQNIREGNYGTAALQVAGALPGVGPLAKAAKIAEEARALKSVAPATRVEFPKTDPALLTVHNVWSHRLPMAERLGGAPVPSLAIINPEHGFSSFGDITLVGSPEMARPSRLNPVFASDVYSPRFPSIEDDGERIFRGFTPSGYRRYAPLTMENVVREMKGNIRGGEGGAGLYGAGSLRSQVTPQFKSLESIQRSRGKIIPKEEFKPLKDQTNKRLGELASRLHPYSKYSGDAWDHSRNLIETLSDVAKGRHRAWSEDYNDLPQELKEEAMDYLKYLRNMPTEYFEAKPQRAVGYGEFEGAVVPQDIIEEASPALKRLGTKEIIPYNPKETGAQQRAFELFKPHFFADGGEVTVDNALRMARGRPDEGGQERFLREQLAGSAPQYEPSQDFPARAERAVQAADHYAGVLNDLAARGAGFPKEFQSPQGRSAREIVESALPQDPNAVVKQAMRQASEGNRLAAAETMLGGIPETGAIRAYHGSPHRFDRFDLSKIGTGEGAQAYGHGLYFAENPKVAEQYREFLASRNNDLTDPGNLAASLMYRTPTGTREAAIREAQFLLRSIDQMPAAYKHDPGVKERTQKALEILQSGGELPKQGGHMYEVEIAAEPHQLLDWDKPLSEQPPQVRNIIRKSDFYKKALDEYKNQKQWYLDPRQKTGESYLKYMRAGVPSEARGVLNPEGSLLEAGIPGIQYLDAGSRGAGEGSRNFVIFDPSLIDIKRRYADGGDVTVDNALRMARNMGGGTLYNQLNYALNSPTPANPPQDPGPQQPYYQSLPQTREMVQQYGTPAPGAPTSSPVRQPMPYAKGGKAIWNKPRPKSLGKSEPLSPSQKASAKAAAKAAGRPYPNMIDNIRAARKADGGQVEGDVQFAPSDLPMMARQPDVEIENALRMARGRPDETSQQRFLKEQLAGSAPQYDPEAGLRTAKEAGQMIAGMTTPGAIADIGGYLGGPSLRENIREGNYGTAAMQALGAVPVAGPIAKGLGAAKLAMFLGPKAKNVNLEALDLAKKLAKENVPMTGAEGITAQTKWHAAPEKYHVDAFGEPLPASWWTEISDKPSSFELKSYMDDVYWDKPPMEKEKVMREGFEVPLGQVFEHPELYKAYPFLSDMPVKIEGYEKYANELTPHLAYYSPKKRAIGLTHYVAHGDPKEAKQSLLHEIMHAIQHYEGAESGYNPEIGGVVNPEYIQWNNNYKTIPELKEYTDLKNTKEFNEALNAAEKLYIEKYIDKTGEIAEKIRALPKGPERDPLYKQLEDNARRYNEEKNKLFPILARGEKLKNYLLDNKITIERPKEPFLDPQQSYLRSRGETQARQVEERSNLPQSGIEAIHPEDTLLHMKNGYPYRAQVFRRGNEPYDVE